MILPAVGKSGHRLDLEAKEQTPPAKGAGAVLSGLVNAGLATKLVDRVGRGAETVEITRGWEITPAGRQALREI
jgi:hypothetical protein